jgi:hypothetical protein
MLTIRESSQEEENKSSDLLKLKNRLELSSFDKNNKNKSQTQLIVEKESSKNGIYSQLNRQIEVNNKKQLKTKITSFFFSLFCYF